MKSHSHSWNEPNKITITAKLSIVKSYNIGRTGGLRGLKYITGEILQRFKD